MFGFSDSHSSSDENYKPLVRNKNKGKVMERLSLAGSPQKGKSPRQKQNKKQQKQQNKKSHFYSEFGIVGGEVSFAPIRKESLILVVIDISTILVF